MLSSSEWFETLRRLSECFATIFAPSVMPKVLSPVFVTSSCTPFLCALFHLSVPSDRVVRPSRVFCSTVARFPESTLRGLGAHGDGDRSSYSVFVPSALWSVALPL